MLKLHAFLPWINHSDKHTNGKHSVTKFRPVGVLNTFSNIYEKIVKDFLICKMEHHFSSLISAYRESFSTKHVLIRLTGKFLGVEIDNKLNFEQT